MYTYFTKEDIEAKISKVEDCGGVVVDLKENDDTVLVMFGGDAPFRYVLADDVAKMITSNENACAIVDCDEGMMVFPSKRDKEEHRGWRV